MNRNESLSYLYDFARFLMAHIKGEPPEIILFGSVARGDFHKESDIDLFISAKNKKEQKELEQTAKAALREFEAAAASSWRLKGIDFPIKIIAGDLGSPKWSALKREIISSGRVIYGGYRELPQKLAHHYLLSFQLTTLLPKSKVKFIRKVYGYESRKERKVYQHRGILQGRGTKINQNTVILSAGQLGVFLGLFKQFKVKHQVREIWM